MIWELLAGILRSTLPKATEATTRKYIGHSMLPNGTKSKQARHVQQVLLVADLEGSAVRSAHTAGVPNEPCIVR